jgi:ketosteroid isomerase-like protein
MQNNVTIARNIYTSINARQFDEVLKFVSDECVWVDIPSGKIYMGRDGFKKLQESWLKSFPDRQIEVINSVASGEQVVVEFIGRGTHHTVVQAGSQAAPKTGSQNEEEAPRVGDKIELFFCDVIHIKDGKIESGRTYYDYSRILKQIIAAGKRSAA